MSRFERGDIDLAAILRRAINRNEEEHERLHYANACDTLCSAIGAADRESSRTFQEQEHLTVDQRLKAAEVAALLSIAQELSAIRHGGISPEYDQS